VIGALPSGQLGPVALRASLAPEIALGDLLRVADPPVGECGRAKQHRHHGRRGKEPPAGASRGRGLLVGRWLGRLLRRRHGSHRAKT